MCANCLQAKLIDQQAGKWSEIAVPLELGLDCGRYKWWQNQTFLEVFFLIPEKVSAKQVIHRQYEIYCKSADADSNVKAATTLLLENS